MPFPTIPETITVHLGRPDQPARNITVPFIDYIKNVASSEIYPTWPENAIRSNIYAQVTYALNRIYTEWYRSRGYDFDITNSTQYDQYYVEGRDIFQNISEIVDDVFNDYVRRQGSVEPLFTQYCDGIRVQCDGLSQWGTVDLAKQGLTPYQILQRYYGENIDIIFNAPIESNIPSYPGTALRRGMANEEIRTIQRQLNRIRVNYPAIPLISRTDGVFEQETEAAVKAFQRIFNLTPDGIVGKATWYKIKNIYNGVKGLSELVSEGLSFTEVDRAYPRVIKEGDTGEYVRFIQYYLAVIGYFDNDLQPLALDGYFGPQTKAAVTEFQIKHGLTPDGVVGQQTWNKMVSVYSSIINSLPPHLQNVRQDIYPGYILTLGSSGSSVELMQRYLNAISQRDTAIPPVDVDGVFGTQTEQAVTVFQQQNGLIPDGAIGPLTWIAIVQTYQNYYPE